MQALTELEYVKPNGGYHNTGIKYKITYWDNYQKLRKEIKNFLLLQIEKLKQEVRTGTEHHETPMEHQKQK